MTDTYVSPEIEVIVFSTTSASDSPDIITESDNVPTLPDIPI